MFFYRVMILFQKILPPNLPRDFRRKVKNLLIICVSLLVLGVGNLTYGQIKYSEYRQALKKATHDLTPRRRRNQIPLIERTINIDEQEKYIQKIQHKINFYTLTINGGISFIVISLVFFISALVSVKSFLKDNTSD